MYSIKISEAKKISDSHKLIRQLLSAELGIICEMLLYKLHSECPWRLRYVLGRWLKMISSQDM